MALKSLREEGPTQHGQVLNWHAVWRLEEAHAAWLDEGERKGAFPLIIGVDAQVIPQNARINSNFKGVEGGNPEDQRGVGARVEAIGVCCCQEGRP